MKRRAARRRRDERLRLCGAGGHAKPTATHRREFALGVGPQRGWNDVVPEPIPEGPVALSVGTCLGPYEVLAPLGTGGMGEVYKARDTRLDRTVAIKILPDILAGDPGFRERRY